MDKENLNLTVDNLFKKIKHFLITNLGKVEKEASIQEFYTAFCFALREEIMTNWLATEKSFEKQNTKILYYLSMEYLPGKFLNNNVTNLKANDLLKELLKKSNRKISDLLECDSEPGLGNGGLGRLASCFLDSLATQKYPAIGYGLRYQYGIFSQELWEGKQIERPDCWLLNYFPWEFKKDFHSVSIYYKGSLIPATNSHGDEIFHLEDYEEVRALPHDIPIIGYSHQSDFSVLTLRLWSTKESPKNFELQRYNAGELGEAGENNSLTDVLYPNDNNEVGKRIRLKQEFLLACASLQDIFRRFEKNYDNVYLFPEKVEIQINDTHPALLIAELMRRLVKNYDMPWEKAWDITKTSCNYTNHSTLKEALEEWNEKRVEYLLPRQYKTIQKINQMFCNEVRQKFPNDEEKIQRLSFFANGQIKMSHLAIYGSKKINGVSQIHEEILKTKLFKDFYDMYPEKFLNINNGVTPRRWLLNCNPSLSQFITSKIGKEWITDFKKLEKLHDFADDKESQEEFIKIKKNNKTRLIEFFYKENPIRNYKGKIVGRFPCLPENSLFDVHIKRFHEYKRQLLNALHLLILYDELKRDINSRKIKRMVIVGGKAAPGYTIAKQTIILFFCIARKIHLDAKVSQKLRLALIENYNVSKAEIIIPAADLSEQISTAGLEASGTGNMKLALNGALTLGSIDGANIEMKNLITEKWWPFSFGKTAEEIKEARPTYKSWEIYTKNPKIKKAIDTLKDGSLVKTEEEHRALTNLYERLLTTKERMADYYFVLSDLESYYQTQKKVEELFLDKNLWAKYAIHNIASMGYFSSDYSVENYAKNIWKLQKCPIDENILKMVKAEYFDIS
ncbi:MAG: glycogen phosphorylase [Chlamydiae bacterium SM23_39]|nr:MAG: glycogen phosphorylase [Chlamydiae bacterium SM23_39]